MLKATHYGEVTRFDLARTIAGSGRYWTTCYWIDGLLIDSGCAHTRLELLSALGDLPVTHILNSHTHEDHIGANGELQRQRNGLEILAHPEAIPKLGNPRQALQLQPYRRFFWGWPEPSRANPILDGAWIETERHSFQAIYTPGHSADHLCLYEAERGWIFSGDLFVGGRDRALGASYDIWEIIASLKRIAALSAKTLFPGSARVREGPQEALDSKIAYLEETGQRVLEMHHQGSRQSEIARALFGGPMWIERITLGRFSRRNLVRSYLKTPQSEQR